MLKQERGVTLVALVITIIVLLILAGVSIAMLTGENGVLTKAKSSQAEQAIGEAKEDVALKINELAAEFYEKKYVKNETVSATTVGEYVATGLRSVTSSKWSAAADATVAADTKITITQKDNDGKECVTTYDASEGTLDDWERVTPATTGNN